MNQVMDPMSPVTQTLLLVTFTLLMMWLLHWVLNGIDAGSRAWQQRVRARLGVAPGKRLGELRWVLVALHGIVWPLLGWAVLHIWGLHSAGEDFREALFGNGFNVLGVHLVPGKILLGSLYFIVLFTFTRWLTRKIERDWLPRTGMDLGVRQSVATLFGYVTFVVAVVVGLSSAGFDFTKLAIVAGALSVGIGFGLQNIVNNFVSGLIILFERPIRIGDYIFVGETQGFVRRIRIRSTELETWDRESVIVPNSDLLSSHLRNLALRNSFGRVILPVGVAYGSDTQRVRQLLLDAALAHPQVIQEGRIHDMPGPAVLFTDFGDNALLFELRAYVREVDNRLGVASDLRFAIERAFRESGIEIPFPQRDVWLRTPAHPTNPAVPPAMPPSS